MHRAAVSTFFFLAGFGFASAYTRLPDLKQSLGLDEGELGAALLGPALGSLASMLLVGALIPRLGSRLPTLLGALLHAAALGLVGLADSFTTFFLALALVGLGNGALDVAMNDQAARVEAHHGRPIMASFHGLFSFGGLCGAGVGGALAARGVSVPTHCWVLTAFLAMLAMLASPGLLAPPPSRTAEARQKARAPLPELAPLCLIAFCCLVGEGAVADWSAVYLREWLGAGPGLAAGGFVAFSLAMTAGRLSGDRFTAAFGPVATVGWGGMVVAGGLTAGLLAANPYAMMAGLGMVGLGLSCVIPIVFSAAARVGEAGPSIATVSTIGYLGFLAGPPAIGFLARATSLTLALGLIAVLACLAAALSPMMRGHRVPARS